VFGCFRRMISLVVLAVVMVAAFATRDVWVPRVRAALGASPAADVAARDSAVAAKERADTGWAKLSFPASERGRASLARLRGPKGPAFVNLTAGEFAGALLDSLTEQLPASTDSLQVRADGTEFQVRASVRLGDLGGTAVLGPLASMVGDRERLTLGGTLEPTSVVGVAQFKLTRVKVGDFSVPSAVVPRLAKALKRRPSAAGTETSALPIRLPTGVGDIRVAQGKVTLYRATP
jgi:hypothetical protein